MSKNKNSKNTNDLILSYSKLRNASARILNEAEKIKDTQYIISQNALDELKASLNYYQKLSKDIQNKIKETDMKEHENKKDHNPFLKEILDSFPSNNDTYQKMRIVEDSEGLLSLKEASQEMHLSQNELKDLLEENFLFPIKVKDTQYIPHIFCTRPDKLNELKKFIQNSKTNESWDLLEFLVTPNAKYNYTKPINILFKKGYQELAN